MTRNLLMAFMAFFLWMGCQQKAQNNSSSKSEIKIAVKVAPVVQKALSDTVRFFGEIALRNELKLSSQFDGRLNHFQLYLGDRVHQGQIIGEIIPPQREALLQILPKIDPKLQPILQKQIQTIPLSCPIDGTVLQVYLHNGDVLSKGQPIVRIGNLDVLDVLGDLPVSALRGAQKQKIMRMECIDFVHRPLALPVAAIGGDVDPAKQTCTVRLTLINQQHLFKPGMRVRLSFPAALHPNALVIPRAALLEHEGIYSVFVVQKGRAVEKQIQIGIKQPQWIEVLNGLKAGEKVVTEKAYSLVNGMEVTTE